MKGLDMKRSLFLFLTVTFSFFTAGFSCAQNGPTKPTVVLTWTQGTPANSGPITANCVYRGTASGAYQMPAVFCSSSPITTFTDTNVARGDTWHYAVTCKAGQIEGPFSNDSAATVQNAPGAPTLNAPTETKLRVESVPDLVARVEWK